MDRSILEFATEKVRRVEFSELKATIEFGNGSILEINPDFEVNDPEFVQRMVNSVGEFFNIALVRYEDAKDREGGTPGPQEKA